MGICACIRMNNICQKYVNINDLENSYSNERILNNSILDNKSRNKNIELNVQNYNKSTGNVTYERSYELNMLNEINFARTNPKEYADKLKDLTQFIIKEGDTEYLITKKLNEKILLKTGSRIFYDTIKYLNHLEPVHQLEWSNDIKIKFGTIINNNFIEDNNQILDNQDLILTGENIGKLILNKRLELLQKYKKCFFNIGIINDPILSIVFQITDEAFNQERRNAILNKDFTIFAVNYIEDNRKNFISICSFAY
jgi:hypothetical protein